MFPSINLIILCNNSEWRKFKTASYTHHIERRNKKSLIYLINMWQKWLHQEMPCSSITVHNRQAFTLIAHSACCTFIWFAIRIQFHKDSFSHIYHGVPVYCYIPPVVFLHCFIPSKSTDIEYIQNLECNTYSWALSTAEWAEVLMKCLNCFLSTASLRYG